MVGEAVFVQVLDARAGALWARGNRHHSLDSCQEVAVQGFLNLLPSKARVAAQGTTVQWTVLGPVNHTVTDSSGMGLFDSGSMSFITYFAFVFSAAGKYSYQCTIHPTLMNGAVSVPMDVPAAGTIGTPFTVTWASAGTADLRLRVRRTGQDSRGEHVVKLATGAKVGSSVRLRSLS